MADAGDLGKLPPEIRKEIYTYLLVEDDVIPIKRFPRAISNRTCDTAALQLWWTKRSSQILRVNKLIREEAAQALYGCNKFEFLNAVTLRHFLQQIGDAKRHLGHVAICQDGLVFMNSWTSMEKSIQILASVRAIRTLEVSHTRLCHNGRPKISTEELVQHCKPLLHALNADFVKKGLNTSVLEVINIVLPRSDGGYVSFCCANREHIRKVLITNYATKKARNIMSELECGCRCRKADDVNNQLKQELREEIAKQLKLQPP